MKKTLKWLAIAVVLLVVAAFIGLSVLAGGPKDAVDMVRYALPHMRVGNLKVGDRAPDVQLVSLDGRTRFRLRQRLTTGRPLVLIFGSFT